MMVDSIQEIEDELNHAMSFADTGERLKELREIQEEQAERLAIRRATEARKALENDPSYWRRLYELEVEKAVTLKKTRRKNLLLIRGAVLTILLALIGSWFEG